MEIIYKGTLYTVPVTAPSELNGARLYNLATQTRIDAELVSKGSTTNAYDYTMTLTPTETASIPQGVYNLELFSNDTNGGTIIQAYYENYAKVKESSFTKDYA